MNGLDISETEFLEMKPISRELTMFRNVVVIRKQQTTYRFHRKIQYYWLSAITLVIATIVGVRV